MNNSHDNIESALFEFLKMKAFLENNVTFRVPTIELVPIDEAQKYVNSILLIDLISVFDMAVKHFFKFHKLKKQKKKSPFTILEENGYIFNPRYLEWYRSWRHETAHEMVRHESFKVNQATRDIVKQFEYWGIEVAQFRFVGYNMVESNGVVKIGVRVNNVCIFEYEVWSDRPDSGSSRKTVDLSWGEFIKTQD